MYETSRSIQCMQVYVYNVWNFLGIYNVYNVYIYNVWNFLGLSNVCKFMYTMYETS